MSTAHDLQAPSDPRRALGRRPGAQPPKLQIDDSIDDIPPSPTFGHPSSPHAQPVSLSIPVPSPTRQGFSLSTSPSSPTSRKFRRPTISRSKQQNVSVKGLHETRKLLSHLLDRLEERESAPDLLARATVSARETAAFRKGERQSRVGKIGQVVATATHAGLSVAQGHSAHHAAGTSGNLRSVGGITSDDQEEQTTLGEGEWDTDRVCDLVEQMRDLLVLADRQGLDLFAPDRESHGSSPNVRLTKRKPGRLSSFTSPVSPVKDPMDELNNSFEAGTRAEFGRVLLDRLISTLASLIRVDCLHTTCQFRLLRPPNSLQAACLDIASYLYEKCESVVKVEMCEMVTVALYTMGTGMTERVCEWLEGRLAELLKKLTRESDVHEQAATETTTWDNPFAFGTTAAALPTFAISSDIPDPLEGVAPTGPRSHASDSPFTPSTHHSRLSGGGALNSTSTKASPFSLRLASLVPRLLFSIASTIDLTRSKLTTIYRVHRILSNILTTEPGAALSLLEIVAYGPAESRRMGVEILATFFPETIGHNAIARRPALTTYFAQRMRWETGQDKVLGEDLAEEHHFVPWRISAHDGESMVEPQDGRCSVCQGDIHGFCLRCTLCREHRHLHCYQHRIPMQGFHYEVITVSSRDPAPVPAHVKFSVCLPRLDEQTLDGSTRHGDAHSTRRRVGQHDLNLVNLFTTTLCEECRSPLWGGTAQSYACLNGCQRFFHPACTDRLATRGLGVCRPGKEIIVDEVAAEGRNPFAIPLSSLVDSFKRRLQHLCLPADAVGSRTYDEIAILYGSLWVQYQLVKNGLSSGSLQPLAAGKKVESDCLGLRPYLKAYEAHLRLNREAASSAATDFATVSNGGFLLGQGYLFSDRYLTYCTALLRSPPFISAISPDTSEGYLSPQGLGILHHGPTEPNDEGETYDALSLETIARSLGRDLNIHDPVLVTLFLDQLRLEGLITLPKRRALSAIDISDPSRWVSFGSPLLMDSSPNVELLVLSIDVLLEDLDLTMNEVGLSLLTRRAFPSLMCSPQALRRLGRALIRWVVSEEEVLHEIVRKFASRHRRLPGIYKEDRIALRQRYVDPWLRALHTQDSALYAEVVYDECRSSNGTFTNVNRHITDTYHDRCLAESEGHHNAALFANRTLERMTIVAESGLLLGLNLDLIVAWLEDLDSLASEDIAYRSLPRMLGYAIQPPNEPLEDIWTLCQITLSEGSVGLGKVCKWLRVMSLSGVEIPWPILSATIDVQSAETGAWEAFADTVIAVKENSARIDTEAFATLCRQLFLGFVNGQAQYASVTSSETRTGVLHQILVITLRAYGVSAEDISGTALYLSHEQKKQFSSVSKKKRMMSSAALLSIDDHLIASLSSLLENKEYPTEVLLDFMWLLFTRSTSTANIDGFLHRQCSVLYPVLWQLVDDHSVRKSRARVFLRLLAVDPAPMEGIVKTEFHSGNRIELRERLLRFVLELADESVTADNLSWRRASVGLTVLFFEALMDHNDVSPDNLVVVRALLPPQLKAISGCFADYLVQSSDERRLALLGRLQKLRIVLPSWPILSWRTLEDILVEVTGSVAQLTPARSSQTMSALQDAQKVRANLIALGLDMIAAGIDIPWIPAHRFQQHVAKAMALPWSPPSDALTTLVLPSLRSVLDSSLKVGTSAQQSADLAAKSKKTSLVGALFVPAAIDLGQELLSVNHDFVTKRTLLDILKVIFFKQNVETVELGALGALQSIAEFCRDGEGDENRLFGLGILQMAMTRVSKGSLAKAVPIIFAIVSDLVLDLTEQGGDRAMIDQSKRLLRTLIQTFGHSRLFVYLFKNDSINMESRGSSSLARTLAILRAEEQSGALGSLKNGVVDLAIGDLPDIFKRDRQTVQQVLESFERFTRGVEGEISEDATIHFGSFLTRLGKHVAEWDRYQFDPNPILHSCAALLALAPVEASVMLMHQTSTLLHLCLTRHEVTRDTISRLLESTRTVTVGRQTEDTIRTVLFELAGSAIGGQMTGPTTLNTLLHFVANQAFPDRPAPRSPEHRFTMQERQVLSGSVPGCVSLLLWSHPTARKNGKDSSLTSSTLSLAASILVKAEQATPGVLSHHLDSIRDEAAIVQLGLFTNVLLASVDVYMGKSRQGLLTLYPVLARATALCLRASADLLGLTDVAGDGADNLCVVFAVFQLAVMAAQDPPTTSAASDESSDPPGPTADPKTPANLAQQAVESLWSRIWPDWYRLLALSTEATCVNGPLRSISQTVFLDALSFLAQVGSPLLVTHAGSLNHALRMLRRNPGTALMGHGASKIVKAEEAVRNAGVFKITVDQSALVKSIKDDLLAAERLKALRGSSG